MSSKLFKAFDQHRQEIRDIVRKYNALNPRIFGSVLHGCDTDESDLDILVDRVPHVTTFMSIGGIKAEIPLGLMR